MIKPPFLPEPAPDTEAKTKHLPADERRAVTVEAVVHLAGEQNPGDITTSAIAKHMKLTQGALFRHFPSKEAIWQAVMEWVSDRLLARLDRAAYGVESPLAALEAIFFSHIEFVAEHPGVPRMMFGELQKAESSMPKRIAQSLMQAYSLRISAQIERGKACGEIAAGLDTRAAAMLFLGSVQGLVMQSLLSGGLEHLRSDAGAVFAIYRRALLAGAKPEVVLKQASLTPVTLTPVTPGNSGGELLP